MTDALKTNKAVITVIAALRDAGWTVLPPPAEEIPAPAVGQVWRAPSARVEARTVVEIGPHRYWPEHGDKCVFFSTASGRWYLNPVAWHAWARKSGARPECGK